MGIPSSLQTRVIGRDKLGLKKCSNSGRKKQNRVPIISVKKQRHEKCIPQREKHVVTPLGKSPRHLLSAWRSTPEEQRGGYLSKPPFGVHCSEPVLLGKMGVGKTLTLGPENTPPELKTPFFSLCPAKNQSPGTADTQERGAHRKAPNPPSSQKAALHPANLTGCRVFRHTCHFLQKPMRFCF